MNKFSDNPGVPWPAVDGLGRALPTPESVGPPKPNRFVGIFYFLWLGQHDQPGAGPFDVSKIMAGHPDALRNPDSPPWGPAGHMHFWGEPLYGYYLVSDPWVLRRHAHLLADAGVDTLIFDTTNRVTYKNVYMKLCEVFAQVRREGGRTPQITFMTNTEAGATADELLNDLYKPGLYPEIWFRWEGKPLLICDPAAAGPAVKDFFTLRKAHWPFQMINTPYAWHWEAAYPQPYGYTTDPDRPEQVNVSIAQNLRASDGQVTNMSRGDARGRSFHDGKLDRSPGAVNHGHNAREQWKRALELDPPFVMVTGWNEWIAGRYGNENEPVMFVDQFDEEFSRDIEIMKGGHLDHYYYQLVDGVRRYKGAPPLPKASAPKTIDVRGGFDQWNDVGPEFSDHAGETIPRDHAGVANLHYRNDTGRNELIAMKVARDDRNLYFLARTEKAITPRTDPNWMMLLIEVAGAKGANWEGRNFIVNRTPPGADRAILERCVGGWNWEKVAEVAFRVEGNRLHLAVPRAALGLPEGRAAFALNFKWADNVRPGDVMDFYISGDVAPQGRFKFRYAAE
ncbi:MAG TPA: hypothetical protein PL033_12135 [Candidatus Brocadiia bacterium]|nr:hypothetical protein [Candidatus Brocadiia bacterium]